MIAFFLCALAAYLGLFALVRAVLMATVLWGGGPPVPTPALAMSLVVGLRFDLAVSLYAIAPLFLLNAPFYIAGRESSGPLRRFNRVYLAAFFFLFAFLGAVEREFFIAFHARLNAYALDWGDQPGFVLGMIWEMYPVVTVFLVLGLLLWAFVWAMRRAERRCYGLARRGGRRGGMGRVRSGISSRARSIRIGAVAVALPLLFLGIRGTIHHKSPLRWGHAYFSPYPFANQMALNGVFTLVDSFRSSGMSVDELREALGIDDPAAGTAARIPGPTGADAPVRRAYAAVERLTRDGRGRAIDFPLREYSYDAPERRLNVVIVLLESFSRARLDRQEAAGDTLFFLRLRERGIYFTRFYSNGYHTYMGLFSALFGMPNPHGQSILKRAEGRQAFSGIVNILAARGWHTLFGVSHDPNFDNMAGFLRGNGVERVISEFDFDRSEALSTLGVPDHRLFERMTAAFDETPEPFLGVILTTNNHGPWVIPEVPGRTFRSTFEYTDWALRHFLDLAAREPWFGRTLFVITADHGGAIDPIHDLDLESFHVPCLIWAPGVGDSAGGGRGEGPWGGVGDRGVGGSGAISGGGTRGSGAVEITPPRVVETVGSHIDLTETILGLLRVDHRTTNLGRDLLGPESPAAAGNPGGVAPGIASRAAPGVAPGFALVQEREAIGLVRDGWYLIDRIGGRASLYRIGAGRSRRGIGDGATADRIGERGQSPAGPADPTRDRAAEEPARFDRMRDAARAYYYVANDMILNRRAGVETYGARAHRTGRPDGHGGIGPRVTGRSDATASARPPAAGGSPATFAERPPGDGPFTEGWIYPGQPGGKMKRSCLDAFDMP